jgi:putative transposase
MADCPLQRNGSSDRYLGRPAAPRGYAVRSSTVFPLRDRDRKYGQTFTRVAAGSRIEILETPYRVPKANAICERFLGSVRRECLEHLLILGESHLYRVIKEYVKYFDQARPHQGIEQKIPEGTLSVREDERKRKIIAFLVLNRLHHDYRNAA